MYDLIIIGGGPSGSSAGRVAGQSGLKTLLFEKEIFPRYKPCGGAFSEQAMSYLDFQIPGNIQERNIYGARVHYGGQVIEKHKEYRISTLVTRSVLDNYLIGKAEETGIEIIMGEKVLDFKEENDYVELCSGNNVYRAKYLIIAEGSAGKLKYKIRKKDKKDEFGLCIVTEIKEDSRVIDNYIHNAIDIYFGVAKHGYGWIFPHDNYFSAGIGGLVQDLPNPKKAMLDFLAANGFKGKYKLKGHLIPAGGIKRNIISRRVILSGDAAGFVDSFYGEGIAYAIRSGQLAAETVSRIIIQNNKKNLIKEYPIRCQNEFGNNLKYSLILSKLMHRFPDIFFKIFAGNEDVIDKYLEIPSSKRSYKSYLQWLILRLPKYLLLK